jgi:hypothetical protein
MARNSIHIIFWNHVARSGPMFTELHIYVLRKNIRRKNITHKAVPRLITTLWTGETWGRGKLTAALDGGKWMVSSPGCFTLEDRLPSVHWIGYWEGLRASQDGLATGKKSARYDNWAPVVKPGFKTFTDWIVLVVLNRVSILKSTDILKSATIIDSTYEYYVGHRPLPDLIETIFRKMTLPRLQVIGCYYTDRSVTTWNNLAQAVTFYFLFWRFWVRILRRSFIL